MLHFQSLFLLPLLHWSFVLLFLLQHFWKNCSLCHWPSHPVGHAQNISGKKHLKIDFYVCFFPYIFSSQFQKLRSIVGQGKYQDRDYGVKIYIQSAYSDFTYEHFCRPPGVGDPEIDYKNNIKPKSLKFIRLFGTVRKRTLILWNISYLTSQPLWGQNNIYGKEQKRTDCTNFF